MMFIFDLFLTFLDKKGQLITQANDQQITQ